MTGHHLSRRGRLLGAVGAAAAGLLAACGDDGEGEPTAELVESVYGLRCEVIPDPQTGTPLVIPAARGARR